MTTCARHPGVVASWHCPRCGKDWCERCAQAVKGVCQSFAFCPDCRDFCEKISEGK